MHDKMSLSELQIRQPWTVPYSSKFKEASDDLPYLRATHAVLHAMKSVGKLATVFEALDHSKSASASKEQVDTIAAMSADLVTAAMRLANLYSFDLQFVLEQRVKEKNGVGFDDIEIPRSEYG